MSGPAMPQALVAEQSVLGCILSDNACLPLVASIIDPAMFSLAENQAIYRTAAQMIMRGDLADVVTVHEQGGHDLQLLDRLANCVLSTRMAGQYAKLMRDRWRRREAIRIAGLLMDEASNVDESAPELEPVIDRAVGLLMKLSEGRVEKEPTAIDDLLGPWMEAFQARAEGRTDAISTGLSELDRRTAGGGRRGELWVIGARPSMGKSAQSLSLALHAETQVPGLVLTMEDSADTWISRAVAHRGGVPLSDLRDPGAAMAEGRGDAMFGGVVDGVEALRGARLLVDDQAGLGLAEIRKKVRQAKRRHPDLGLVVVDYLQLMSGDDGDNRNQRLGFIANGLAQLAKEENVWLVLLSQLSREAEKVSGPPQIHHLRDSGDIEGAGTVILMLHREGRRDERYPQDWAQINICKQKNGPTGIMSAKFDGAHQRWSDWHGPDPKPVGKAAQYSGGLD